MENGKLQLCLISGSNATGKTTLNSKLFYAINDSLTSFVDTDDVRATFQSYFHDLEVKHGQSIQGVSPSPLFYKSFYDLSIDNFVKHCQEVQDIAITPMIKGSIKRELNRCIISGVHLIPGQFCDSEFPQVATRKMLVVNSDKAEYWTRFKAREMAQQKQAKALKHRCIVTNDGNIPFRRCQFGTSFNDINTEKGVSNAD